MSPARSPITMYRVYFNRFNEAPLYWSVDTGDDTEEYKLSAVDITGGRITTGVNMQNRGSEDKPCVWLQLEGHLSVEGTRGTIRGAGPATADRMPDGQAWSQPHETLSL